MMQTDHRANSPANWRPVEVHGADRSMLRRLYCVMRTARRVDELEAEMVSAGEAFFHVSGAGHEGSAILDAFLAPDDWLHCHFRDKALLLARGVPPEMFSTACDAMRPRIRPAAR